MGSGGRGFVLKWALRQAVRAPLSALIRVVVLAAAVALLAAVLFFVHDSLGGVTTAAVGSVPVDWQGPVGSYDQAVSVAGSVQGMAGVSAAVPVATAPFAGMEHQADVGRIRSSSGAILAVPPAYLEKLHTFRFLHGGIVTGQIVLDQQLAATLQAAVGDTVTLTPRADGPGQQFTVSGVVLVTAPDILFQPLDPMAGPAPAQPPAEIAILPLATFAEKVASQLPTLGSGTAAPPAAATTATAGQTPAAPSLPGEPAGTQWQVQVQLAPESLGAGPGAALKLAEQTRRRVERSLPGQVRFVDNLAESLSSAASDSLYADALYIMLALPGALIALGLVYLAALGTVERDRRDLALLRARGATRRRLLGMALAESVLVGVVAGAVGVAAGWLAVNLLVPGGVASGPVAFAAITAACMLLAVGGAAAARIGAGLGVFRQSVVEARSSVRRSGRPLWQRLYLDLAALIASGLITWLTLRTGFSAVVNPDSNPTLSLAVYMFFGPALLWIGATLALLRLRGGLLARLVRRSGSAPPRGLGGFLLASAGRRGAALNRGLLAVGLLMAFAVELGIFAATYHQQAIVDAQLTLGADVVAAAPPGVAAAGDLATRIGAVPGVKATTSVDHSYAYVGPDLQDTYGIDAATFTKATALRDSYFRGGTSAQMLERLRQTPDGILVAEETIADYQLARGDLLKLRVLDRKTGRFVVADFHVVGTVLEFPSAPKDSFMVTNLKYLQAATHDSGPNAVFARVTGDPVAVAAAVAKATAADGTSVRDIRTQTAATVSAITTVDLVGIARIEEAFVVLLAAAAMGLYLSLALSERRRELGTMLALGAPLRSVAAFLWSEAALILGAGVVLAAGLGWLLAVELVAMLTHVFDPPPDALAIPWGFLAVLLAAAVLGTVIAGVAATRRLQRLPLGEILREQ
jgi:putative ABC transport system permease protein